MSLAPSQTLLVLLVAAGCYGVVRGPGREIWTVCSMALLAIFLNFGGLTMLKQLPVHIVAGIQALSGDQRASNETAAHPLDEPWTVISLWVCTITLIALAYALGNVFGSPKSKDPSFNEHLRGFILGAIEGLIISVFIFQNNFFSSIKIQFPNGSVTNNSIAPVLAGVFLLLIIAYFTRKKPAPAKSA